MTGILVRPLEQLSATLLCDGVESDGTNCERTFHWVAPGYDTYSVRRLALRTRGWSSGRHRDLCPACSTLRLDAFDSGYLDYRREQYRAAQRFESVAM